MLCLIASRQWRSILQLSVNTNRLLSNSGRVSCIPIKDKLPDCHPKMLKECQKKKKAERRKDFVFKHLLQNPDCCKVVCPNLVPRFDDLYYKPSNKNRLYTQTWKSCKSPLYKKKMICCMDKVRPIPYKKRIHPPRRKVTKCNPRATNLMPCIKIDSRCPIIRMPCCPPVRIPVTCKIKRQVTECFKICTPYPSFSECSRDKIKSKAFKECNCLATVSICKLYDMMRLGLIKLPKRGK